MSPSRGQKELNIKIFYSSKGYVSLLIEWILLNSYTTFLIFFSIIRELKFCVLNVQNVFCFLISRLQYLQSVFHIYVTGHQIEQDQNKTATVINMSKTNNLNYYWTFHTQCTRTCWNQLNKGCQRLPKHQNI